MFAFDDARRDALVSDILRLVRGEPTDLLPFEAVREKLRLRHTVDRGFVDVPLDQIVGSLGRDRDFNRLFLPREDSLRKRWERVRRMAVGQRGIPSVELYRVGEIYFVLDGHHRISVLRSFGAPTVEAHVLEFVTDVALQTDDSLSDVALRRGRADLLEATGLDIEATEPDAYERLLEHISVHAWLKGKPWNEAVTSWRETVFDPVVRLIRESEVLAQFPGRTEADLYLYAMDHLYFLKERYGDASPGAAVEELRQEKLSVRDRMKRFARWLVGARKSREA